MPPCDVLSICCRAVVPGKSSHGKATTLQSISLSIPWLTGGRPLEFMNYVHTFMSMRSLHMVGMYTGTCSFSQRHTIKASVRVICQQSRHIFACRRRHQAFYLAPVS